MKIFFTTLLGINLMIKSFFSENNIFLAKGNKKKITVVMKLNMFSFFILLNYTRFKYHFSIRNKNTVISLKINH